MGYNFFFASFFKSFNLSVDFKNLRRITMDHTQAKQAQEKVKNENEPNGPVYPPEKVTHVTEEPSCCCGCEYEGTTTTCAVLNCCPFGCCCCCGCSIFYCCIACQGRNPDAAYAA